jgi:hypothetical protein
MIGFEFATERQAKNCEVIAYANPSDIRSRNRVCGFGGQFDKTG